MLPINVEEMIVSELHQVFRGTAYYLQQTHNPNIYLNYALKGEVGELHNLAKKMMLGDGKDYRPHMVLELGDVWYYFVELLTLSNLNIYDIINTATNDALGIDCEDLAFSILDAQWATNALRAPYSIQSIKLDLDELYRYAWTLDYSRDPSGYINKLHAADFFQILMKIHRKLQISVVETLQAHIAKIQSRGKEYYAGSITQTVHTTDTSKALGCDANPGGQDEYGDCKCPCAADDGNNGDY